MKRDYIQTFATEFAIMAAMVVAYKLAARYWTVDQFAQYSLLRRSVGLVQLPLAVGVGIAVPRYVAVALAQAAPDRAARYFFAACVVGIVPMSVALLALNLAAPAVAGLLFGDSDLAPLVPGLSLVVLGLNLHAISYGFLRGHLAMKAANALQFAVRGLLPVLPFVVASMSVERLVALMGTATCLVAGGALIWLGRRAWQAAGKQRLTRTELRELLVFGGPRVPGEIAMTALLALPGILVAHRAGVREGGLLAFGISMLTMIGACFAPIGLIMLPTVSGLAAQEKNAALRIMVWKVLRASLFLAVVGVTLFAVIARWFIGVYLGPDYLGAAGLARLVMLGAIPYVTYVVLRNALDALKVAPLNARNVIVALGVLLAGGVAARTASQVALALVAALLVLGLTTVRDVRALLGRSDGGKQDRD